jgi:hypothetical protein
MSTQILECSQNIGAAAGQFSLDTLGIAPESRGKPEGSASNLQQPNALAGVDGRLGERGDIRSEAIGKR